MNTIVKNMETLARKEHEGQFRKGPERLPYIVHPEAVVRQLEDWGVGDDEIGCLARAIGWGHDLLEDTKVTKEEIVAAGGRFGERVYEGIKALSFTPPEGLDDVEWDALKAGYVAKVAEAAAKEALVVKMADRLCNVRDFLKGGRRMKAAMYFGEGKALFGRVNELPWADAVKRTYFEITKELVN